MDAFTTAFDKLRALKAGIDDKADEAQQGLVRMNTSLGIPQEQAQNITNLAQSGAAMTGSIEPVPTKIFRDPSSLPSLPPEVRAESLKKLLGLIQSGKGALLKGAGIIK